MKKINKVEKTKKNKHPPRVPFGHRARLPGWKEERTLQPVRCCPAGRAASPRLILGKAEQVRQGTAGVQGTRARHADNVCRTSLASHFRCQPGTRMKYAGIAFDSGAELIGQINELFEEYVCLFHTRKGILRASS